MRLFELWNRLRPLLVAFGIALFLQAASCGDFTLFDDEDGGGDGDGDGSEASCTVPFTRVDQYTRFDQLSAEDALDDPVALAVVPDGASFTWDSRGLEAGDVLVADRGAGRIVAYKANGVHFNMVNNISTPGGLAFFSSIGRTEGEEDILLLFYSSGDSNSIFIEDLAGTVFPEGQSSVEVTNDVLDGTPFLEPAALAAHGDRDQALLFVLNRNRGAANAQSIVRLALSLEADPTFDTATLARNFSSLQGIAYRSSSDQLFFSQNEPGIEFQDQGRIYRLTDASSRTVALDGLANPAPFIEDPDFPSPIGLAAPPTNRDATQSSALLVTHELVPEFLFLQFSPSNGSFEFALGAADLDRPLAVAYDCANGRILFTNIPYNLELSPTLWEIRR
ncbi:MAG: hypothetical protein AB1640_13885 [bacterium]